MSFQQGLSGLKASSKSLEVIGNNVANASTVGFKESRAQFSDVYANSLIGSGASQVGIGTSLSTVAQQFTQGNITGTNNTLDISINGPGFYRMSNNGDVTYSRNGQFQLDKLGYLVDAQAKRLTGYQANAAGILDKGAPQEIRIDASDLVPNPTTEIETKVNLDSRNTGLLVGSFDPDDPTTYHNSTAISVFDSLGNAHTMQSFYVKDSTDPNLWNVFVTANGNPTYTGTTPNGTLAFPLAGTGVNPTSTPNPIVAGFTPITGATAVSVNIDLSNSTQFGSSFSVNTNNQDGYASGQLAAFNTGADGIITGRFTNGQSKTLGQVVLANFVNMNGLRPLGGNAWAESSDSGAPLVGEPNTGQLGVLQSSSQEDSNVDLTEELVNMITAQRVYQANAQTIKTQDQVLQTLVNLR
jgi:flagellar hook protein FlgE